MIAVIADDFTGAAEIGGIGLRYGLRVVIETEDIQNHNADLLIIATDTRSLCAREASEHVFRITKELEKLNPKFIYKKVDSVLRGNIIEELSAQMEASGKQKAILIAANPVFKRIIRNGLYYIDDIPLHETCFATDPEYPINSSSVIQITGQRKDIVVTSLKPEDNLPERGIVIGDATNSYDLGKWASKIDEQTLIAGASGFFEALLVKESFQQSEMYSAPVPYGKNFLYVLGSTFPKDFDFIKKLQESNYYLSNMPKEIYNNKNFDHSYLEYWAEDIIQAIRKHQKVAVSVVHSPSNEPEITSRIKAIMGALIKKVSEKTEINELIIEGGSTTYMILEYLNIKKLFPVHEFDTGVIRMKIDGWHNLYLTTKPGSYYWPDSFWQPSEMLQTNNN
jgi:D-threonate/D-erythronate kinase